MRRPSWTFLEDTRSFAPRLAREDHYRPRGCAVWVIGSGVPPIWTMLRQRDAC